MRSHFPVSRLQRNSLGLMALEPRLMYDGAGAATAAAAIKHNAPAAQVQAATPSLDGGKHEIVFIDSNVANWQAIASDVAPGKEVVLFNGNGDGLAEIAGYLAADTNVDAVHIVSHGASGQLFAGTDAITDATLPSYQADLTAISHALKPGGDILLYGCDIATGPAGEQFITDLAADTGDVVAASTQAVGAAAEGGSWTLDARTGALSVDTISASDYTGILSPLPNFSQNFETTAPGSTWEYNTSWGGATGSSVNGAELTQNAGAQNGLLVYNSSFSAVDGIDLKFTYYMGPQLPGNSADGLAFFLLDGSQAVPTSAGSFGGGLGYNSISAGILGVGFDEYGNFSGGHSPTYEGNIVVKGSTADSNPYLTAVQPSSSGAPETPGSGSPSYIEGTNTTEVILLYNNANSHYDLTVKLNGITEISNYDITAAGVTLPSTLRFGFSASTGGAENEHSVESVSVTVPTSVTGLSTASWTGSSSADVAKTATADDTPILSGTAAAGDTIAVYVDGTQIGTTTANASGDWAYTVGNALPDGTHTLSATDTTANASSPGYALTIDTPPTVTGAGGTGIHTDIGDTPAITGTAAPGTPSGTTITVYSDGSQIGTTTTSDSAGDWSFTPTTALPDGSHSITATEYLNGVTSGTAAGYALSVTTPPTISTIDGILAATADDNSHAVISGTAAASTPAGSTITVFIDGTQAGTTTTTSGDTWSFTPGTALAAGAHAITATETVGGVTSSASASYGLTIYAPPVITGITAASYMGPSAADAAKTATADGLPTISGTAQPNASVTIFNNGTSIGTTTANGSGAWSFTPSALLSVSTHSLTAKETISTYTSPATSAYSLVIDTPPVFLEAQPGSVSGTYTVTYDVSGSAIAVDTIATVTEDSAATIYTEHANYVGGSLTASTTNPTGSDALDIGRAAGVSTTAGAISVTSAGAVYLGTGSGATQVGSVSGAGTNSLTISFTSSLVTDAAVQVLARMIDYSNGIGSSGTAPGAADAITMTVTTGYGNSSSQTTDIAFTNSHGANNAPTLGLNTTGVNATVATNGATSAQVVNSSLTLAGSATVTAASVVVENFQSGDVLGFTNANGLTGSYNSGTGVLSVTGSGTTATYQSFLRDVTFYTTSSSTAARTLSFVVGGGLYNSSTNRFFEYVADNGVTWYNAEVLASQMTLDGMSGYLANVNSAADNAFVASKLSGQGWMGASNNAISPTASSTDSLYIGHWHWIDGPDSMMVGSDGLPGEYFFQQTSGDYTEPTQPWPSSGGGGYAIAGIYTNWNGGEPNDDTNEHYAHFLNTAYWNDFNYANSSINGYVVEFGGMPSDPTLNVTGNATVDVVNSISVTQPAISASSVTGPASSGVTRDTSQVFTGTATGGATVTLYTGSTVVGTGTANASGAWTIDTSFGQGQYSITAKAAEFGLTSSTSAATSLTVDVTAPTVAITSVGPVTTGDAADVTASTTPVISGTVTDNDAGTPTVTVYIDGVDVGLATVSSGTWSITAPTMTHGVHEVAVTATDVAGNTSTLTSQTAFTVDTPPTIGTSSIVSNQGVSEATTMTVSEDSSGTLQLYAHDVAGDPLVWQPGVGPAHGVVSVSSTGLVTYTPTPGQTANDSFLVAVTDGLGGTAYEQVNIAVTAVNHAPVLTPVPGGVSLGATTESVTNALSTGTQFHIFGSVNSSGDLTSGVAITDTDNTSSATIGNNIRSVAVTSVDNTNGEWFYTTNNGSTWTPFTTNTGGVESILGSAVLLNGANGGPVTEYVKFIPNVNFVGTAGISYVAWDAPSSQTAGSTVNLSSPTATGGNTHFSSATQIAYTTVTAVDAPPVLQTSTTAPEFVDAATSAGFNGSGPVLVDPLLTLTNPADVNTAHDNITEVTIGVTASASVIGTDVLAVNTAVAGGPAGLSSGFAGGVLTLTGSGTAAQWQALLRTLTYQDTATSDTGASTATRTITYAVTAGGQAGTRAFSGDTVTKSVTVTAITATDALEGIPFTAFPNTFDVNILDAAGTDNGTGLLLTVTAYGGAIAGDTFALANNPNDQRGAVTTNGAGGTTLGASGSIYVGGTAVGTYTDAGGVLTIQFASGGSAPGQDQVNAVLNQIVYTTATGTAVEATLRDDSTGTDPAQTLMAAVSTHGSPVTPFPATTWLSFSNIFDLNNLDYSDNVTGGTGTLTMVLENSAGPSASDEFFLADNAAGAEGAVTGDSSTGVTTLDGNGSGIFLGATQIATYSVSGGVLTINFTAEPQTFGVTGEDAIKDVVSQIQYQNVTPGTYLLSARLTDDNGTSQTVTSSVTSSGTPVTALPGVLFSGPDPAQELVGPDPIILQVERATLTELTPLPEDNFTGSDGLSFNASSVTLDGATIGSSGVVSGGVLTLTLNAGLSDTQINEVLGLIQYTDTSATPTGTNAGDSYTTTVPVVAILSQDNLTAMAARASMTLAALNNPPAETLPSGLSVNENTPLAISGFSVTDADAGGNDLVTTVQVDHGMLTVTPSGSAAISGNDTSTLTLTGSQTDITNSLNTLEYTSLGAFAGTDALLVSTNDQGFSGVDGPKTTTAATTITVNWVNHAPVLDTAGPITLQPINEQSGSPAEATNTTINGTPVADLIPGGAITDVDVPYNAANKTTGIAVTSVDNTNGEWFYSTNDGTTWTAFTGATGGVENIAANSVLLDGAATGAATNMVKFVPNAYWNSAVGPANPSLTYVAWDQSDGNAAGDTEDATSTGGGTPFSSATETVSQPVTPVNDAPTLTLLTDGGQMDAGGLTVIGNRGLHSIAGFATTTTGPGSDEASQALSYSITTTNGSLFSLAPTISADGTLSYVTATGATGSSTVTVTLADNGGTANGGINSVTDTFTITVNAPAPLATPAITGLTAGTDSGGNNDTSDTSPTVAGTIAMSDVSDTIEVYIDGTLAGDATVDPSTGAWTYAVGSQGNGQHVITAVATNIYNDRSATSNSLDVTIDTTTPAAPVITGITAVTDTGMLGDGVTANTSPVLTGTALANSTVSIYQDATLLGTATADGSGNWTFALSSLADDTYAMTARDTNLAGTTGSASTAFSLTVDSTAPAAPVITGLSAATDTGSSNHDGITADTSPLIMGTAPDNATVSVYDGTTLLGSVTADASGAWSLTASALVDGSHVITATDTDAAAVTSVSSASYGVVIDTSTPATPVITGITTATDSGAAGDGLTKYTQPVITGTAAANGLVTIYDGTTELGTTTANGSGTWSFMPGSNLSSTTHVLTATTTDIAGNVSATSLAWDLTVDTSIPATPVITGITAGSDTGTLGDGITADANPVVTGTGPVDDTITLYDGTTIIGTGVVNGSGVWTISTTTVGNAVHSITATASNAAADVSPASAGYALTIDTHTPTAPAIAGLTAATDSGTLGDGVTSDTTPAFTGTAEAGGTVTVSIDGTVVGTTIAAGNGTWTFPVSSALADGTHTVTATATDAAGTTGASASYDVTIDTHTPAAPNEISVTTGTGGDNTGTTNVTTPSVSGVAEAGSTVTVMIDGTAVGTATAGPNGFWTFTVPSALTDGTYTVTTTTTDAAGTTGPSSTPYALVIDTHMPAAPANIGLSAATDTGQPGFTSNTTPAVTGSAEPGSSVIVYVDGTAVGSVTVPASGTWTFALPSALADGQHMITASATDTAGTTGPAGSFELTIDTHIPTQPVIAGMTAASETGVGSNGVITANRTPTITGSAEPGSIVSVYDGTTLLGTAQANAGGAWSFTLPALADGNHGITATATDAAGTTGAVSSVVPLTIAPTLNVPLMAQTWSGGSPQTLTLPQGAFPGAGQGVFQAPAGDMLTFSATGLPPWASINPLTGAVTGTVPIAASGIANIIITATDPNGDSVSSGFPLTYAGPPAPVAPAAPPPSPPPPSPPTTPEATSQPTLMTVVTGGATPSGDTGGQSGDDSFGGDLGAPTTFGSAAAPGNQPTLTTASSDGFQIAVVRSTTTGAGDLSVVKPSVDVDQNASGGFSYSVGVDTFTHTDATAVVHLVATLVDGSPLPAWLAFNPKTGALTGTPPASAKGVIINVKVTAADNEGHQAVAQVRLDLTGRPAQSGARAHAPRHAEETPHRHAMQPRTAMGARPYPHVRPGFTAQLRTADRGAQLARDAAALRAAAQRLRSA